MEPSPPPPRAPIPLAAWAAANADKLRPPVGNHCLYQGADMVVMVIGGPNTRNDFHINPTEEWFYQLKGDMLLRVVEDDGRFRDIAIREGEALLVPGLTPHSPQRFADTVGLVVQRTRPEGSMDRLRWYCPNTGAHGGRAVVIRDESFYCDDVEARIKALIDDWMANEAGRRCGCGETAPPC